MQRILREHRQKPNWPSLKTDLLQQSGATYAVAAAGPEIKPRDIPVAPKPHDHHHAFAPLGNIQVYMLSKFLADQEHDHYQNHLSQSTLKFYSSRKKATLRV